MIFEHYDGKFFFNVHMDTIYERRKIESKSFNVDYTDSYNAKIEINLNEEEALESVLYVLSFIDKCYRIKNVIFDNNHIEIIVCDFNMSISNMCYILLPYSYNLHDSCIMLKSRLLELLKE